MTDDGAADPRLARALASYDGSAAAHAEALAALAAARVFVAITATATAEGTTSSGLRAESSADMALVSLVASDGERAIPAFMDAAAVAAWRVAFRPVPVPGAALARAALDDGAAAVLVDPQGTALVVRRNELTAMASTGDG